MRALVQSLPKLEGLLSSGAAHALDLYLALCEAAGSVACLDGQPCPAQFPPYVHNDPLPAFLSIAQFIEHAVARLHEPYRAVRFSLDQGRFQLELRPEWLEDGKLVIGVRAAAGQAPNGVAEWLMGAWIGCTSRMRTIRDRRILGAPRRPIERVDALGLVPPRQVLLFAVEVDPQFVIAGELLEIASSRGPDAAGQPTQAMLYVPPERLSPETAGGSR